MNKIILKLLAWMKQVNATFGVVAKDIKNLEDNKADLVDGLVPSYQLPSYVDDVIDLVDIVTANPTAGMVKGKKYYNKTTKKILIATSATAVKEENPEEDKIYINTKDTTCWRWSGSELVQIIGGGLVLGETASTAYRGDRGKVAYDHSQIKIGNPHNTSKADIGLGNADNTSDKNKPISEATQKVLDDKLNIDGVNQNHYRINVFRKTEVGVANKFSYCDLEILDGFSGAIDLSLISGWSLGNTQGFYKKLFVSAQTKDTAPTNTYSKLLITEQNIQKGFATSGLIFDPEAKRYYIRLYKILKTTNNALGISLEIRTLTKCTPEKFKLTPWVHVDTNEGFPDIEKVQPVLPVILNFAPYSNFENGVYNNWFTGYGITTIVDNKLVKTFNEENVASRVQYITTLPAGTYTWTFNSKSDVEFDRFSITNVTVIKSELKSSSTDFITSFVTFTVKDPKLKIELRVYVKTPSIDKKVEIDWHTITNGEIPSEIWIKSIFDDQFKGIGIKQIQHILNLLKINLR